MGKPTRSIVEQGTLGIASIVLDILRGMVEADIVKAACAAQGAAIQGVFSPF